MSQIDALGRPAHLLIVDDDDRIRALLQKFLSRRGAICSTAADAEAARRLLAGLDFDLLIVDVTMPREDGFSLVESVRKVSNAPIVLLTARGLAEDRIRGLAAGADDYVAKPFEPEELALRINAILRRAATLAPPERVSFGPFVFEAARGELSKDGAPVRLTEMEAGLLRLLAARAGGAVSREDLARKLEAGSERAIDVAVTRLRRKLEADPRSPLHLQTVRGVGYRLAAG